MMQTKEKAKETELPEPGPAEQELPRLNAVYAVYAQPEPEVYLVKCNITDVHGESYDADFGSTPDDRHGLGPTVRQWLADNPDFPIQPYVPPEPSPHGPPALPRKIFRQRLLGIGITTATIEAFLVSVADPNRREQRLIDWQEAPAFARDDAFVNELAAYAGKSSQELDRVWEDPP